MTIEELQKILITRGTNNVYFEIRVDAEETQKSLFRIEFIGNDYNYNPLALHPYKVLLKEVYGERELRYYMIAFVNLLTSGQIVIKNP